MTAEGDSERWVAHRREGWTVERDMPYRARVGPELAGRCRPAAGAATGDHGRPLVGGLDPSQPRRRGLPSRVGGHPIEGLS